MRELRSWEERMLLAAHEVSAIVVNGKRRSVAANLASLGLVDYAPRIKGRLPRTGRAHEFRVWILPEGNKVCWRLKQERGGRAKAQTSRTEPV